MLHSRSVRSGSIIIFSAFSAVVRAFLRRKDILLKRRDLGLCLDDVNLREQALLNLAAVARVLLLGQAHGFPLHVEITPRECELPVGLHRLRNYFNNALPELLVAKLDVLLGHLNAMPVVVEQETAPERLCQIEIQRGGELRIERQKRTVARLPRRRQIEFVAAAEKW